MKIDKMFADYTASYTKDILKKKDNNKVEYCCCDDFNHAYFIYKSYMVARCNADYSPFKYNFKYRQLCKSAFDDGKFYYEVKPVKDVTFDTVNNVKLLEFADPDSDKIITRCNYEMFSRYFELDRCRFYVADRNDKNPIMIKELDEFVGLILPVRM